MKFSLRVLGILILVACANAVAGLSFTSLDIRADVGGKSNVTAVYELTNDGPAEKRVVVSFPVLPENAVISSGGKVIRDGVEVLFASGEKRSISLVYSVGPGSSFYFDKNIFVDGSYPGYIRRVAAEYRLSAEYYVVSTDGVVSRMENGTFIRWKKTNANPVLLPRDYKVTYSETSQNISLRKEINSTLLKAKDTATIDIYVYNAGEDVRNLTLTDEVNPEVFRYVSSKDGLLGGPYFLREVVWDIPYLKKGETKVYSYNVVVRQDAEGSVLLSPAEMSLDGSVVRRTSNYLEISIGKASASGIRCVIDGKCTGQEDAFNCPEDCAYSPGGSNESVVVPESNFTAWSVGKSDSGNILQYLLFFGLAFVFLASLALFYLRRPRDTVEKDLDALNKLKGGGGKA